MLFNDILYSIGDEWMSMEHWWNDTGRGKQKYSVKEAWPCSFLSVTETNWYNEELAGALNWRKSIK